MRAPHNSLEHLQRPVATVDLASSQLHLRKLSPAKQTQQQVAVITVVPEVGYLAYGPDAANLLFHVVSERHIRRRPMIFTTNKSPFSEWGPALHDHDLADAIADRILERGRNLVLDGPSYRTRHLTVDKPAVADSTQSAIISGNSRPNYSEPTFATETPRISLSEGLTRSAGSPGSSMRHYAPGRRA